MTLTKTICKGLYLGLTILIMTSCREDKPQDLVLTPEQEENSKQCESFSLFDDFSMSVQYLKTLVSCLNDPGAEGSSLSHQLELMEQMGDQGLQSVIDLLFSPHPESHHLGIDYPYLSALTVLAHRGSIDTSGSPLVDSEMRFEKTQSFLLGIAPQEAARTVLYWAEKKILNDVLRELGGIIEKLPQGFVSGYAREFLTGDLRRDIITIAGELLDRPENFQLIDSAMGTLKFAEFKNDSLDSCLRRESTCLRSNKTQTISRFFNEFWSSQDQVVKEKVSQTLASVLVDLLNNDEAEISYYLSEASKIFKGFVNTDRLASKKLGTLIYLAQDTQLDEIKDFMSALQTVRSNPSYFDALQEKVGSSILQKELFEFLWLGGESSLCSVSFSGFKTAKNKEDISNLLAMAIGPQASCQQSIVDSWLMERLSLNCAGECARLGPQIVDFNEKLSSRQWQDLLNYSLTDLLGELKANPYYLVDRNLSFQVWPTAAFSEIESLRDGNSVYDLSSYFVFKKKFEGLDSIRSLIPKDFLNIWLSRSIESLSSTSEQFQSLFDMTAQSDERLLRILSGVYPNGPVDQVLSSNLNPRALSERLTPPVELSQKEWSQLFSSAVDTHAYFRNPEASFKGNTEDFQFKQPFSIQNPMIFASDSSKEESPQFMSLKNILWQGKDWSWSLHQRFWDKQAIHTASLPTEKAEIIRKWLATDGQGQINQEGFWNEELTKTMEIPQSLIQSDRYQAEELRLLALYGSQNFLAKAKFGSELTWQNNESNRLNEISAISAAYGPAALSGSARSWSAYQLFYNGFLRGGSLKEIIQQWQAKEVEIRDELNASARNPKLIGQGKFNAADRERLSSHQRELLLLNSATFIYESREELYFQSLFGFDQHCSNRSTGEWQGSQCPGRVQSFSQYQRQLAKQVLRAFCPLVSTSSGLSSEIAHNLREALGLADSSANMAILCQEESKLVVADGLPTNWLGQSLKDIAHWGKNPRLPMALKTLPARIAVMQSDWEISNRESLRDILNHTSTLDSLGNRIILQRKGLYENLTANKPQFLDYILASLGKRVGVQEFAAALKKLSADADSGYQEPLARSFDLILDQYDQSLSQGHSFLSFLLNTAADLSRSPQLIKSLQNFAGNSHDPYTGILLSYTLPQAFKAKVFKNWAWDEPQYQILKTLLDRNLMASGLLGVDLIENDLSSVLSSLRRVRALYEEESEIDRVLKPLLEKLSTAMIAADWDGDLTERLKMLSRLNMDPTVVNGMSRILLSLRSPLADLSNNWQPSPMESMDQIVLGILDHLPKILSITEGQFPENDDSLLRSLANMVRSLNNEGGAKESFSLLQDSRLGFRDSEAMSRLLLNDDLRENLSRSIEALGRVEVQTVLGALDELEKILPESIKLMDFVNDRLIVEGSGKTDIRQVTQSLHFMGQNPRYLKFNVSLLKQWINNSKQDNNR